MRKTSIIIAAAAAVLTACVKNEDTYTKRSETLSISPVVGKAETRGVITGTTFPTSRNMVVSADLNTSTGVSAVSNYFSNVTFSYASSVWAPATTYYWPLSGGLEILAYSAGSASVTPTWTNATRVVLACTDCTADDILMGGATNATSSSKSVAFKHCLAQVKFTAKASVNSVIKIKAVTINATKGASLTVNKTAGSANVTVSTSLSGSAANVSVYSNTTGTTLSTTAANIGNAILLPAQTPASMTVTYTITNNGVESAQMTVTKSLTTALSAGNSYTFAINATLTGINVTATLTDWVDAGSTTVNI